MKRVIALILSLLMLMSAAACSGSVNESETSGSADTGEVTATSGGSDETEPENKAYTANIPAGTDYGGATVTIYTYPDSGSGIYWCDMDFCFTEETGETLNDALYYRVRDTEEALNVDIGTFAPSDSNGSTLQKSTLASDGAYDFAFVNAMSCDSLAQNGIILNLRSAEALDMDAPWWDQNVIEDLSIAGKVYMLTGDISIMAKKTLRVIYFNKTIAQNYDIQSPYTMVDEMTWTVDNMNAIVEYVSEDLDGDGEMTEKDRYGLIYQANVIYPLMIGCGVTTASKDADDLPVLSFYNDDTQSAWEKITSMCWNENHAYLGDGLKMFMEDKGLFSSIELHNLTYMREMDSDFGILPNPMLSEEQGCYYSTINGNVASMLVVPIDCPDITRTAYVLDTMGAISKNLLTPAYIESYLKGKVSRDNESEKSINIVFDNVRYDLGFCYNWGSLGSFMMNIFQTKKDTLASTYASTEKIASKMIDKAVTAYLEKGN